MSKRLILSLLLTASFTAAAEPLTIEEYWRKTSFPREFVLRFINNLKCESEPHLSACRSALIKAEELAGLAEHAPAAFEFEKSILAAEESTMEKMPPQMFRAQVVAAYLRTFDPYADLVPTQSLSDAHAALNRNYAGIGAVLESNAGKILVREIMPGSPAAKAGMNQDDIVTAATLSNHSFEDIGGNMDKAANLILGPAGSDLKVRVSRRGQALDLAMRRAAVLRPYVTSELRGTVGYLRIESFESFAVFRQVSRQVALLQAKGMKKLILDLRGNPGGDKGTAVRVAELFLGPKRIVGTKGVSNQIPELTEIMRLDPQLLADTGGAIHWEGGYVPNARFTGAMAVLIDGSSASSAEILAGALQDHGRAWLVGSKSFGKGSAQIEDAVPENPSLTLKYTVENFYLPSGRSHQGIGLNPDFGDGAAEFFALTDCPREPVETLDDSRALAQDILRCM